MSEDVPGTTRSAPSPRSPGALEAAASSRDPPARGAVRLMDTLSALLLAAATFAVVLAATPALVRAALSEDRSAVVARGAGHTAPRQSTPDRARPYIESTPDDAEPDGRIPHDDLERLSPHAQPARPALDLEELGAESHKGGDDDPTPRRDSIQLGLARHTFKLYEQAGDVGLVLGEIKVGEQVVIIKEAGAWALIVHNGKMGWARKSEIAIR